MIARKIVYEQTIGLVTEYAASSGILDCLASQSFADMFYEQNLYVRDDDVANHVTSLNYFFR